MLVLLAGAGVFADYWFGLPEGVEARYVGRESCAKCHQTQANLFARSDHDLAMDPATDEWTTLASNSVNRGYHSVSLLLPDATVLHGASGDANVPNSNQAYPNERSHEIFHPPYLYRGARPVVSNAPATVTYGQDFLVETPNAAQVTDVRWIHLGSVTHAFDQSARANSLAFARAATGVTVTAPASPNAAPPGHYLLFILNRNGVPSSATIVRVQ